MTKLLITVVSVVAAVGLFTLLWVGVNRMFDLTRDHWGRFSAFAGGIVGFIFFGILHGNRLLTTIADPEPVRERLTWGSVRTPTTFLGDFVVLLYWAVPGALIVGALAFALSKVTSREQRLAVGIGSGLIVGIVVAATLKTRYQPALKMVPMLTWPIVLAGIAAGIAAIRGRSGMALVRPAAVFGAIGWLIGTFGESTLGRGTEAEAWMAVIVPCLLIGLAVGSTAYPDDVKRTNIEQNARGWIFMGPAVAFISVALILPGLITGILSFQGNQDEAGSFVAVDNYVEIFRQDTLTRVTLPEGSFAFDGDTVTVLDPDGLNAAIEAESGESSDIAASYTLSDAVTFTERDGTGSVLIEARGWNEENFDLSNWSWFFTSRLTWIGGFFLLLGGGLIMLQGQRVGRRTDITPQSGAISAVGVVLLAFALFSVLRGTIINNLWWILTVTFFATTFGLAIAAWSDGAKGERIAKSIIFMPMAISFVGASIIWRFMYRSQVPVKPQTGVMNAFWTWLASKTNGAAPNISDPDFDADRWNQIGIGIFEWEFFRFNGKWLIAAVFAALGLFFLYRAVRSYPKHREAGVAGWGLAAAFPLYLAVLTITSGIGGYEIVNDQTIPQAVLFREEGPFNNFWLMVVLLWIETGFAMVILSAAIKAVPAEFIEAAKIDGADDTQVFWRITIPQIAPTIGVVVTTIIVKVTKVYDIVNVMTGGNFGTNVLANRMIDQSFQFANFGTGAALAVLLFLSVLPIMVTNIRRMQREAS